MTDPTPAVPAAPSEYRLVGPEGQDIGGIESVVRGMRASVPSEHDPGSPVYQRPDLVAQYRERIEAGIADVLARAGVKQEASTAQQIAERNHAQRFSYEMPKNLVAELDQRAAALEAKGAEYIQAETAALEHKLGAEAYDALAEDVEAAFGDGAKVPPAVFADEYAMKMLASVGRYNKAYLATAPKV